MTTKYDVGDEIIFSVKGYVKRIGIEETGTCYTVIVDDGTGRDTYLYVDDDLFQNGNTVVLRKRSNNTPV